MENIAKYILIFRSPGTSFKYFQRVERTQLLIDMVSIKS